MGRFWKWTVDAILQDDLVLRVSLAIFGAGAIALGISAFCWVFQSDETWGWLLGIAAIGVLFTAWGLIVFVAAFTPPSNPWSNMAEKCYPDPSGLDDALVFLVVVLFPAVLLTLLLRACGVRGYELKL